MQRFAYYIAAHHRPDQLGRLVNTLRRGSPEAIIVLHLDGTKGLIDANEYSKMTNVHVVPNPTRVEWGRYSQLEMSFNTLSWMMANVSFDWVAHLSGQDFPLQPLPAIERFYFSGNHDGYISGVPLDSGMPCEIVCLQSDPATASAACTECVQRYHYQYHDISLLDNLAGRLPLVRRFYRRFKRRVSRHGGRLQMRTWPDARCEKTILGIRKDRIFTEDFRCHKGSAWYTLNRHAVSRLLEFLDANPGKVRHFRRTLVADEMVIQTVLNNQPDVRICGDNQRFIEWETIHSPHPTTLTTAHYDMMIESGKHFARKFDMEVDSRILDLLERRVLDNAC